jgi:hypothetical protein
MLPFILDIMSPGPWPVQYYVLNHYLRLPRVLDKAMHSNLCRFGTEAPPNSRGRPPSITLYMLDS